jgi:hypothetical protein
MTSKEEGAAWKDNISFRHEGLEFPSVIPLLLSVRALIMSVAIIRAE